MPYDVENLTNRHIKCGDWVFLPKKTQRNIPDDCVPLEAWRQAQEPDPTLRITDPDEDLLLVIPDLDPNGS
jgi:hypothetical protein